MKKNIVLAVIATAAMALSLVGCGVKVTNISVPDVKNGDGAVVLTTCTVLFL